jgi:hypothetical protein
MTTPIKASANGVQLSTSFILKSPDCMGTFIPLWLFYPYNPSLLTIK